MASTQSFIKIWAVNNHNNSNHRQLCSCSQQKANHQTQKQNAHQVALPTISRRSAAILIVSLLPLMQHSAVLARERRNKKNIPLEDYLTGLLGESFCNGRNKSSFVGSKWIFQGPSGNTKRQADGIKYYDVVEGKGPVAEKSATVQVHFDCVYRGITAVSSRESKILAGNRIIAQPYEFQIGATPGKERKREFVDNPNGLFSAQAAPKPPKVMYTITEGMKVGGKRTVIVTPEAGYGQKGMNEIPPGATFELNIELLEVKPPQRS